MVVQNTPQARSAGSELGFRDIKTKTRDIRFRPSAEIIQKISAMAAAALLTECRLASDGVRLLPGANPAKAKVRVERRITTHLFQACCVAMAASQLKGDILALPLTWNRLNLVLCICFREMHGDRVLEVGLAPEGCRIAPLSGGEEFRQYSMKNKRRKR